MNVIALDNKIDNQVAFILKEKVQLKKYTLQEKHLLNESTVMIRYIDQN